MTVVRTADLAADLAADSKADALIHASGLPQRWRGRERFVVLDTDFATGHAFIATWRAWRADPQRCGWLSVVALCERFPSRTDLQAAHRPASDELAALLCAWPPSTPDLHTLSFEQGRLQLLLAFGALRERLPGLRLQADAVFTSAPLFERDTRLVDLLGRKAAAGCTLAALGGSERTRDSLRRGGFVLRASEATDRVVVADFAPRFAPRRLPEAAVRGRSAAVVGAGISGAAVARALARSGFDVTVLDRHTEPAAEASGNPAGLFHGVVHAGDGRYARLYRAAALRAHAVYAEAIADAGVPGDGQGLLRIVPPPSNLASMQSVLARSGLPASYVQALGPEAASVLAGVPLVHPAWHYPGGGWIDPRAWVRTALAQPGVHFVGGVEVTSLQVVTAAAENEDDRWLLQDRDGLTVARAAVVVLASGAGTVTLAPMPWPLTRSRGQVTFWTGAGSVPTPMRIALAGAGYALPLPDGGLVCGATNELDTGVPDSCGAPPMRLSDQQQNLQRLHDLCGLQPPQAAALLGRAGWRMHANDRLPIGGAMPLQPGPVRRDQARLLPRAQGLFVLAALGSRGLSLAPLLGELIAAQACGAPWPLPQDLADAVDPARWMVRAARAAAQP